MKTTHLIIVLNVFLYIVMVAVAGSGELRGFSAHTLIEFGADNASLVREGEWWRLFDSVFIHITPLHLLMNMFALSQVGLILEPYYGRGRFVALYLAAGVGGSAASFGYHFDGGAISAGASGAICGLIGAGAVAGHLVGGERGRQFRNAMLRWGVIVIAFGFFVGADNAAHVGGGLVGAALAWLFDPRGRERPERGMGLETFVLLALFGVGFGLAVRAHTKAAEQNLSAPD